jgi:Domain of unknown function (DUF4864)
VTSRRVALLVAGVLALAGCDAGGGDATSAAPETPAQGPTAAPDAGADPHGGLACDDATRAGIDDAIAGQLDALGTGDYEAALGYSSSRYRAGIAPDAFGELIGRDYPVLADDAEHTSDTCVAQGDGAQVLVTVTGASGDAQELVYQLVREDGDWRVDVAGAIPEGDAPIEA